MTTTLAVVAIVLTAGLGVVVFLLVSAQVETFRGLKQIREQAGLIDRATPVDLGEARGLPASAVGLPARLDSETSALVLFLSDKCFVCRSIAAGLQGTLPPGLWLVLDPGTAPAGADIAPELGFRPDDVIVDQGRTIMKSIGILLTPLVVVVEHGRLRRASGITSTRQVYEMVGALVPVDTTTIHSLDSDHEGMRA
jgi:hypothetical protein